MKLKPALFLFAMVGVCGVCAPASAEADDGGEAIAQSISMCFHPFSDYVSVRWGERQLSGHSISKSGAVKYRPLDNKVYTMPFTLQVREVDGEREWRVVPDDESDNGKMGPSPECAMRNWRPLK